MQDQLAAAGDTEAIDFALMLDLNLTVAAEQMVRTPARAGG